jgi:hypothetical protein
LIASLLAAFPVDSSEYFKRFVERASPDEMEDLCLAMKHTDADIAVADILAPLLKDQREALHWSQPTRLCDIAAEAIAAHEVDLEFDADAAMTERDAQIDRMWHHCTGIGVRSRR